MRSGASWRKRCAPALLLWAVLLAMISAPAAADISTAMRPPPQLWWEQKTGRCDVKSVPPQDRCKYVKDHAEACKGEGLFDYSTLLYCWLGRWPSAAGTLVGLWVLLLFAVMLVTAEHFFCPAIEELSGYLQLPDHLAGATLMALGNGANDVFVMAAALVSVDSDDGVASALSEAFSSGLFVTNVVLGCALLFAPVHPVEIVPKTFVRDVLFYLGALLLVAFITVDKVLTLWEGLLLAGFYCIYLVVTILLSRGEQPLEAPHPNPAIHHEIPHGRASNGGNHIDFDVLPSLDETISMSLEAPLLPTRGTRRGAPPPLAQIRQTSSLSQAVVSKLGAFERFKAAVEWPLVAALRLVMPQVDPLSRYPRWCAVLMPVCGPLVLLLAHRSVVEQLRSSTLLYGISVSVFAAALVWSAYPADGRSFGPFAAAFVVAAFVQSMLLLNWASTEMMVACGAVGQLVGLSEPFLAATLMAWGSSLQDMVSNVTMSASGFPLVAITACIAAPLFNLLAGIGIGTAMHTLQYGPITDICIPNGTILLFVALTVLLVRYAVEGAARKGKLTQAVGAVSLGLWAAVFPLYILTSVGAIFSEPWMR